MEELRPGLWHWRTRHPEWREGEPWDPNVSSYALDDGANLLLFDPLGVPDELLARADERNPAVVLTAPWHERDARRLGFPVWSAHPETLEDLVAKGFTREQVEAAGGSPDLRWLVHGGGEAHWFWGGDRLPFGIEAFTGWTRHDLVLWVDDCRAVVAGDTLADFGEGIAVNTRWLPEGTTREDVAARLRPLLDLPVELVLPAHGAPTDRAALERALAS